MRKRIGAVVFFALCLGIAACSHEPGEVPTTEPAMTETEPTTGEAEEPIRVAIVLKGTAEENLAFCSGAENAADEAGAECLAMYGEDEAEWEELVLQACEDGYDYVIGAAPEIADYIAEYGEDFPDIGFAVFDAEVSLEHVISVFVSYEEAYFQAGAEAVMFAEQTKAQATEEKTVIGWVSGMNIPMVQDLYQAFLSGAQSVDPEIQVLEQYAGSWEDPEEAKKLSLEQFAQGANVIFSLAGDGDAGVLAAAEDSGFYVIGTEESMGDSKALLMTVGNDMEKIGFLMVRNLLLEEPEWGMVMEFSWNDGCVVIKKSSVMTEMPVATDANA